MADQDIKDIINDVINCRTLSVETKAGMLKGLDKEVNEVKTESIYKAIMSKPLMTGNDILDLPTEPNDYLIQKLLWRGNICFLVGAEKACKSIFTFQQAMAMTMGDYFLDTFDVARPLKVLYAQAEGDMNETKDRILRATDKFGVKWNPDNWRHFFPPALSLDTEQGYVDLRDRIRADEFRPDVIVIDPLYMAMEGDLVDNKAARDFCRNIRRLKEEFGCAFIIVHHEHRPKLDKFKHKIEEGDNAIFGSAMWKNFASHVIRISIVNERGNPIAAEKDEEAEVKYRKLACATQRSGNIVSKLILELSQEPLMLKIKDQRTNSTAENNVLQCVREKGPIAACQVATILSMPDNTVYSCFSKLYKDKKLIERAGDGKRGKVLYKAIKKDLF